MEFPASPANIIVDALKTPQDGNTLPRKHAHMLGVVITIRELHNELHLCNRTHSPADGERRLRDGRLLLLQLQEQKVREGGKRGARERE